MHGRQELAELGERVAEEGARRHERTLHELARAVETRSPGAAAVLGDPTAPEVLRQRALAVASGVLLSTPQPRQEPSSSDPVGDELEQVWRDWQGQLVAWGA
jgi:hypothetical protein